MKKQGRPSSTKNPLIRRKSKGKIKNPKTICLVLEKDLVDFIHKQALQMSMDKGVYVEPNDLIRSAIAKAFPTPKQYDMFGTPKTI